MDGGGRSWGARRNGDVEESEEIRRGGVKDDFEDINEGLEINPVFKWEPLEFLRDGGDVGRRNISDNVGS